MSPILCLVMIVKNEARGIAATLESVKDHVDSWCIVDTGSTDNTPEIIRKTMKGVPGRLYFDRFVDFSTTRNVALELADRTVIPMGVDGWRFMVSGDAIIEHGELLVDTIARAQHLGAVAAYVGIRSGSMEYPQIMLTRAAHGCKFAGVTHEAMNPPDGSKVLAVNDSRSQGLVVHYAPPSDEDRTSRWKLDVELLDRELAGLGPETIATKTRETFYLAQSHECLGNNEKALDLYRTRADMAGWQEERFIAALRAARCMWRLRWPQNKIVEQFKQASRLDPRRAEPHFELATFFRDHGAWASARNSAQDAALMPLPDSMLFIEHDVYRWRAKDLLALAHFHCADFVGAVDTWRDLLASFTLPESEIARVRRNLAFAEAQIAPHAPPEKVAETSP